MQAPSLTCHLPPSQSIHSSSDLAKKASNLLSDVVVSALKLKSWLSVGLLPDGVIISVFKWFEMFFVLIVTISYEVSLNSERNGWLNLLPLLAVLGLVIDRSPILQWFSAQISPAHPFLVTLSPLRFHVLFIMSSK